MKVKGVPVPPRPAGAPRDHLPLSVGAVKTPRDARPIGCLPERLAAPPYSPRMAFATMLRWISFDPP